ncbi:hypothetical protein SAMN05443287_101103 [Micromonospora phaseoli]|uniref:Uncharacterized protein n=1 Tax=Micromonospora phaseoli TaxID=1144548 RepID=A0A1H6RJX4_9ACTN|nr:hypothetical protein [Micromonospora phaseoli]PZW03361.1 hypothetical protein CLV64_101103 [Micromonospora phaseoli]GIJ78304.1 hypothetical protein Xph01_27360 [Micromonospora phaseoli]SEI52110.1 hypothetical protein SAMN05443287_101103 [Micromonospora phaseoli]
MVRGDHAANDAVEARLDAEGWDGLPRFLAAVFFLAVDRRFGETAGRPEVIAFVGELPAGLADGGPEINAEAAEQLIMSMHVFLPTRGDAPTTSREPVDQGSPGRHAGPGNVALVDR